MAASGLQARVDDELKTKAAVICENLEEGNREDAC